MTFDEIQSIWNSQQTLKDQIDPAEWQPWIEARNKSLNKSIGFVEVLMFLLMLFLAAMFFRDPILEGHDRILAVCGIMSLIAAGYIWTGRIARKKREVQYDRSLLGIVEQSIDALDYQRRRLASFVWWFALPMSCALLIGLVIVDPSKRYLFYWIFIPGFALCMGLTYWQIRREIARNISPEKRRLEELREALQSE